MVSRCENDLSIIIAKKKTNWYTITSITGMSACNDRESTVCGNDPCAQRERNKLKLLRNTIDYLSMEYKY